MTRGLGYLPDPADQRDRPVAQLLGALAASPPPSSASVEHPSVLPKDQGATSSCTGQAWAQALRLAYLRAGDPCPELSALFNYFAGRAEWGGQHEDIGSYIRTGAAAAQRFGCATEAAWAFSRAHVNVQPGWSAFRSAHDRRGVRSYHRVDAEPDEIRRAIAAGHAIVGGWQVDDAFLDYSGAGVLTAADPGRIAGGHAIVVTSYAADGTFRILNSWSTSWGRRGYGVVDEAFIREGGDLWVCDVAGGAS